MHCRGKKKRNPRDLQREMGHELVAYPTYVDDISEVSWIGLNFAAQVLNVGPDDFAGFAFIIAMILMNLLDQLLTRDYKVEVVG